MPRSPDNNHDKPIREEINELHYWSLPSSIMLVLQSMEKWNLPSAIPSSIMRVLQSMESRFGYKGSAVHVQWQLRLPEAQTNPMTAQAGVTLHPTELPKYPNDLQCILFLSYVAPSEPHCTIWASLQCTPLSCAMYPIELQCILFWAIPHPFELHCTLLSYPPSHTLHPAELCCTLLNYAATSEQCCTLLSHGHSNESTELRCIHRNYAAPHPTDLRCTPYV
jgi:hypothetical protein